MALVDNECVLRDRLGVDLVGIAEEDELGSGGGGFFGWDEANVVSCCTGGDLYMTK